MVLYVPRWIAAVSVFLSCPVACSLKEVDKLDRPAVSPKAQGPQGVKGGEAGLRPFNYINGICMTMDG